MKNIFSLLLLMASIVSCKGQNKSQSQNETQKPGVHGITKLSMPEDRTPPWPYISCSMKDKAGNLWFGTTKQGVFRCYNKDLLSGKISFTNYTSFDGLLSGVINSIAEDKNGNVWFGTETGACYFDGKTFKSIPIPGTDAANIIPYLGSMLSTNPSRRSKSVFNILTDKKGIVWLGTDSGAYRYDGKNITSLLNNNCFTGARHYCTNRMSPMFEDKKGTIWFSSSLCSYAYRLDERNANNPCLNNTCKHNLKIEKDIEAHNQEIAMCIIEFKPAGGEDLTDVQSMMEDKSGNLWFSTYKNGVFRYDGKALTAFSKKTGLPENFLVSMLEDKAGNIWFGTYGKKSPSYEGIGVFRYDGRNMTHFTTKDGLAGNTINYLTEDKAGNIWFGTNWYGISYYNGKTFTGYTEKNGFFDNHIYSVLADDQGGIWVSTGDMGLSRYNGKTFTNYTEKSTPK